MRSRAIRPVTVLLLAVATASTSGVLAASGGARAEAARTSRPHPLLDGFNAARRAAGVRPLRVLKSLDRSSRDAVLVLTRQSRFAHVGPPALAGLRVHGEIIAFRYGWRARSATPSVLRAWLRSPAHRSVITYRGFRWVGAARVQGYLNGRRATFWVAHFGG